MTVKQIKLIRKGLVVVVELISNNVEDLAIRTHILTVLTNIDAMLDYDQKHIEDIAKAKVKKADK